MVEFITILLGLISGVESLEVSVTEDVATVELFLDGQKVATLDQEPWRADVDFGPELKPRMLDAIARDAAGREVHRSQQLLNVPQARAFLRLIIGKAGSDGTRKGRLVWLSADGEKLLRVSVTLDGEPLAVVANRGFEIPVIDLHSQRAHILSAQAEFSGGSVASATAVLGGVFQDRVASQLTAVPVKVGEGGELPALAAMAGWLEKDGEALEIVAAEHRAAEVVVVRDSSSLASLVALARRFRAARYRAVGTLGANRGVRLLRGTPRREEVSGREQKVDKFSLSEPLSEGYGGVPWVLGSKFFREASAQGVGRSSSKEQGEAEQPQRLADAVAHAGLTASASGWGRAVVLVLGEKPEDESRWSVAQVKGFLRSLRVPLYVWSTLGKARRAELAGFESWEPIEDISTHPDYLAAVGRLARELEQQHILWVKGEHFVHDLQLEHAGSSISLAE